MHKRSLPATKTELRGNKRIHRHPKGSEQAMPGVAKLQSLVHDEGCQLLVQQLERIMPQEDALFQAVSQLVQILQTPQN